MPYHIGDHVFVDDDGLQQMKRDAENAGFPSFFFELLSQVLWNRRDFQRPIKALRKEFHELDSYFGISPDQSDRDRLYGEYQASPDTYHFPDGFWSRAMDVKAEIASKGLFPNDKPWGQFIMTFAYFGCIDIHPLSPLNELEASRYIVTDTKHGIRSFRYEQTDYGIKVELYPGTRPEDISALFKDRRFKALMHGEKGGRISLISKSRIYREFACIMHELAERSPGVRTSEQEILTYIEENYHDFFEHEFRVAIDRDLGQPFTVLETLKKRARKYGFID